VSAHMPVTADTIGPGGAVHRWLAAPAVQSATGLIHDPSNTQADLRQALDRAGYPWVSSHAFRKTVASRLDDEGYGIRHITDQLGHSRPSTTMDNYLGRRALTTIDVTDALEPLVRGSQEMVSFSGSFSGSSPRRRTTIPLYRRPPETRTRNLRIESRSSSFDAGIFGRFYWRFRVVG
jgi:Phage integrase family